MDENDPLRILITGFGPFPGVPVNNSARLAGLLARASRGRWPGHIIEPSVLPTEWRAGPDKLCWLWDTFRPDIAVHFGVSADTDGLHLEAIGRNHCRMDPDAAGLTPLSQEYRAGGPAVCASTLPIERITARLDAIGVRASASDDAGAYLCNAVLYDSLQRAAAAEPAALAGFVHIPTQLTESAAATVSPDGRAPLSWGTAVAGGLAILECALEELMIVRTGVGLAAPPSRLLDAQG